MAEGVNIQALVLDSWPVLEWIRGREPAASAFDKILDLAESGAIKLHMNRLNRGEVIYIIRKSPEILDRENTLNVFLSLPITLHTLDDALVDEAIELKSTYSFAFADAFAAATAIRLNVPVITGDSEFRALENDGLLTLHWVGA